MSIFLLLVLLVLVGVVIYLNGEVHSRNKEILAWMDMHKGEHAWRTEAQAVVEMLRLILGYRKSKWVFIDARCATLSGPVENEGRSICYYDDAKRGDDWVMAYRLPLGSEVTITFIDIGGAQYHLEDRDIFVSRRSWRETVWGISYLRPSGFSN